MKRKKILDTKLGYYCGAKLFRGTVYWKKTTYKSHLCGKDGWTGTIDKHTTHTQHRFLGSIWNNTRVLEKIQLVERSSKLYCVARKVRAVVNAGRNEHR